MNNRFSFAALEGAVVSVFVVVAASACFSNNRIDADMWGHIKFGNDIVASKSIPREVTYSYISTSSWLNHEWLAQVIMALLERSAGVVGMNVAKVCVGISVIGSLLCCNAQRLGIKHLACLFIAALVALNLRHFMICRPQVFTIGFLVLQNCLWNRIRDGSTCQAVGISGLMAALFAVWANCHGGFVLGLGVFTILATERTTQMMRMTSLRWRIGILVLPMAILASACATLVTPYGWTLYSELLASTLLYPSPEIYEWRPFNPAEGDAPAFLMLCGCALIVFCSNPREILQVVTPGMLLILTVVFVEALLHRRHIAICATLLSLWLPQALMRARLNWDAGVFPRASRVVVISALSIGISFLTVQCWKNLTTYPVSRTSYPIDVVEFMKRNNLSGRAIVPYDWAQYVIAALPGVKVPCDGRFRNCFPQEVIDVCFDFELGTTTRRYRAPESGPVDVSALLELGNPIFVLTMRQNALTSETLAARKNEWCLLYQDGISQLWGRSSRVCDCDDSWYMEPSRRQVSDIVSRSVMQWPANVNFCPGDA